MASNRPLNNDEIQLLAPSAFAGQEYEKMSNRYSFVPTSVVIDGMRNAGFLPVHVRQSNTRIVGKQFFTKHEIRFQSTDFSALSVGDTTVQAVLVNSHDGSSTYQISLGAWRKACENGLMVSEGLVEAVRIRHTGSIIDRVIEATTNLLEKAPAVTEAIQLWRGIELSKDEQEAFARAAMRERFEEGDIVPSVEKVLRVNRHADNKNDLWTVYNRLEENLVRGGLKIVNTVTGRRSKTREVKGIDQRNNLERNLWALAQEMAAIKSGS